MTTLNTSSRKIGQRIFLAFLAFNGLVAFGLGATALINFPLALETGFGLPYSSDLDVLGLILGCQLIFLGSLITLAATWTIRGKIEGSTIGIAVGIYLFIFGILSFLRLADITALLFDGLRGLLTIMAAYFARQELKQTS
ncbi:MAG: hypothetical protein AB8G95_06965 [Anaerolineae bacterium]